MPKIVIMDKEIVKGIIIRNFMAGGQDVVDVPLWEGDNLHDFAYLNLPEKKINKVDARLAKVNLAIPSTMCSSATNALVDRAYVQSIEVDASKDKQSNVITIPLDSILEYNHNGIADDATALPAIKLKLHLLLSNDTKQDLEITEGDMFSALIYKTTPAPSIVINNFTVVGFAYTADFDIYGLILNDGETDVTVNLTDIKIFGHEASIIEEVEQAGAKINESDTSSDKPTIVAIREPGNITGTIKLGNTVQVTGVKGGVPANVGDRANDTVDPETENVITEAVSVDKGAEVELDGITFTEGSQITIKEAKTLDFENCKFVQLKPTSSSPTGGDGKKSFQFYTEGGWSKENVGTKDPIKVNFDGCYFGSTQKGEGDRYIYNEIEICRKWANGSAIRNCTFKGNLSHNYFSIYNVEDNATINIENNLVDEATCFVRIAAVGAPKNVTINFKNNRYESHAMDEEDGEDGYGLVLIQPSGADTEDMSGITINIDGTTPLGDEELYSLYLTDADAGMTPEKYPHVVINGEEVSKKKYHVFDKRAKV